MTEYSLSVYSRTRVILSHESGLAAERGTRVHAPAPAARDIATWEQVFVAMRSADYWGSTDANGTPEIWAEVDNDERDNRADGGRPGVQSTN
ncbi:hypothetical protein MBT84_24645 [Streptomyces sp. MBT84]|uniref:hypothetical protein n=1 Tax=unclassified Streptomyces TaxID=2593676 RepID=UPI001C6F2624|nr:hypothetical protein [Streptomyces sp. MBT84]MBW8702793.1 hypothetical protein [Streptomyces sp. MBT84]